jgi:hypothetical protein
MAFSFFFIFFFFLFSHSILFMCEKKPSRHSETVVSRSRAGKKHKHTCLQLSKMVGWLSGYLATNCGAAQTNSTVANLQLWFAIRVLLLCYLLHICPVSMLGTLSLSHHLSHRFRLLL